MAITNRALAFASRWFDEATVRRTFEPLIADWQREWQESSPSRRTRVSLRGFVAFVCAVVVCLPRIAMTSAPSTVTSRIVSRVARFTLLAAALLGVPYLRDINSEWWRGILFLLVIPSTITLSFPFAMVGAVDAIRRHDPLPAHVERAAAFKLAFAAIAIMLVFAGWIVPASNQAWRVAMSPDGASVPARRLPELSTYELLVDPARATAHEPGTWSAARATSIRRELNHRMSLTVLPLVLLWRRWRALDLPAGRWYSPRSAEVATLAVIFTFLFLRFNDRFVEEAWHLPAGVAPWLTLLILAAAGMLRVKWAAMREAHA